MQLFTDFLTKKYIPESVRMKNKDLSGFVPKKDFTIGYEFEIVSNAESSEDYWEDFSNQWYANSDFSPSSFWSDNSSKRDLKNYIRQYKLEPMFGKPKKQDQDEETNEDGIIIPDFDEDEEWLVLNSEDKEVDIRDIEDPEEFFELFKPNRYERWIEDYYHEAEFEQMSQDYEDWYGNTKSEGNGLNHIYDVFSDELDIDINKHDSYHEGNKDFSEWYVEPDSSIKPGGAELVSPAMPYNEALNVLKKVLDTLKNDDEMGTNDSTGLHINIGTFSPEEIKTFDLLKFSIFVGENHVLQTFKRKYNNFAQPNIKKIIEYIQGNGAIENYKETIYAINQKLMNNEKYSFVNFTKLKYGYIELRAVGNSGYERKYDEIIKTIQRVVRCIEIACDPNAYKKEYLTKLYKLNGFPQQEKLSSNREAAGDDSILNGLKKDLTKYNLTNLTFPSNNLDRFITSCINVGIAINRLNIPIEIIKKYYISIRKIILQYKKTQEHSAMVDAKNEIYLQKKYMNPEFFNFLASLIR